MFHYIVENGVTFLCMADEQSRRRIPFAFLEVCDMFINCRVGCNWDCQLAELPGYHYVSKSKYHFYVTIQSKRILYFGTEWYLLVGWRNRPTISDLAFS